GSSGVSLELVGGHRPVHDTGGGRDVALRSEVVDHSAVDLLCGLAGAGPVDAVGSGHVQDTSGVLPLHGHDAVVVAGLLLFGHLGSFAWGGPVWSPRHPAPGTDWLEWAGCQGHHTRVGD